MSSGARNFSFAGTLGQFSGARSNSKTARWTILLASATWSSGEYAPRMRWVDFHRIGPDDRPCSSRKRNLADRCLDLTGEDRQDLLGRVGVAAEMGPRLKLKVNDGGIYSAGTR